MPYLCLYTVKHVTCSKDINYYAMITKTYNKLYYDIELMKPTSIFNQFGLTKDIVLKKQSLT